MAISSIHIMRAIAAAIIHNSRDSYSKSVVFFDEENELWNNTKTAYQIYKEELAKRTLAYTKRTKQKLQKTAVTHLSAVVNLEKHHTLKDLEKIKDELEKVFDTKVFQMAIHRDEGKIKHKETGEYLVSGIDFFYNPDDKKYYTKKAKNIYSNQLNINDYIIQKNYHAHIELMGLDSQGQAIRQKMNRFVLSNLQDFTAQALNMERGNNYQIKKSVKRLDTHEFKKLKKVENELKKISVLQKNKIVEKANEIIEGGNETIRKQKEDKKKLKEELEELKKANNQLREELKAKDGVTRDEFKAQEDLNKELQAELKDTKIDLATALTKIEELKNTLLEKEEELDHYGYREKLTELKEVKKELKLKNKTVEDLTLKVQELLKEIDLINHQNSNLNVIQVKPKETQNNHQEISLNLERR